MKYDFQPFFQVDLLLPILGNLGAVCQCWTIFPQITQSYSIMVHTARVPCCNQDLYHQQTAHEQYMNDQNDVGQVYDTSTKF